MAIYADFILAINTGSIAALNYADRLSNFVYALIAVAISNAVYPEIAEAVTKQQKEKLIGTLNHSLNGLFLIVLPATIGLLILSEPLVRIAFQRGAFDTTATKLTVLAFLFLSMGLPAICLREVLLRVFYSLQDTVTPMLIGIGTVTLNIMLVIILTKSMALGGLALANSISVTVGYVVMLWFLRNKLGQMNGKMMMLTGVKVCFSSGIMGIIVYVFCQWLQSNVNPSLTRDLIVILLSCLLGVTVYLATIKLLRVREVDFVLFKVKNFFQIERFKRTINDI